MANRLHGGVWPTMITPFQSNGAKSIDYDGLEGAFQLICRSQFNTELKRTFQVLLNGISSLEWQVSLLSACQVRCMM